MLAVLCRLALEPRRAAQNGSADTGKPNYFSVRCGNRSNETHFTTEAQRSRRRQGLSFWRSSGLTWSDPPRLCRRSSWILCERAVGRCCGNRSNETHFTTEVTEVTEKQELSFWRSSGLTWSDPPRLCRRSGWILCERAVGRCCGNRSNETHFTTEVTEVTEEARAFLLAIFRLDVE